MTRSVEQLHRHRIAAHPLTEGPEVLLGKDRGWGEKGHLLASHERLEGRPQGDFGLAEADITAEESVHRTRGFHVTLDLPQGPELVGRFPVGETRLEFPLPRGVRTVGMSLPGLPLGLEFQKASGIEKDRLLGRLPRLRPLVVVERGECGCMLPHPDIPRDVPRLIDGDEKPGLVGELQRQHLPLLTVRGGELLQSEKAAHTMVGVDHQVPLGELGEIDVGSGGPLPLASQVEATEAQTRGSAEKFRLREDRKPPPRVAEAAGDRSKADFRKGISGKGPRGEFEKTLALALGRAHQDDSPTGFLPFRKMPEELSATGLVDHEITRTEGGEGDRVKGLPSGFRILPCHAFQRC